MDVLIPYLQTTEELKVLIRLMQGEAETPAGQMKRLAESLQLPAAAAGYALQGSAACSAEELLENGIRVLMADDTANTRKADGLWHVRAIGNMSSNVYAVYQSGRRSTETMTFVVGSLREDQRYDLPNFEAMLDTFSKDGLSVTAQHIHTLLETDVPMTAAEYDQRHRELKAQWNEVMRQIGNLRQQMALSEAD